VPLKARLIGSVDSRRLVRVLRFVAERIWIPGLAIVAALELDLVALVGYDGKQAVAICDAKRFQHPFRSIGKRIANHRQRSQKANGGDIANQNQAPRGDNGGSKPQPASRSETCWDCVRLRALFWPNGRGIEFRFPLSR